ncbi:glycoside hydrolase N-terminal domain-containing protein [Gracilibacillus sp. YIM 98692]|uniref:glycosyl hydrolase family 95 catalytic domain-containing protein n=1 Tax=Gracilibacillus sp. YIM 98692 TaxID=2663532 RepID=UPI0013CFA886|nr:glycoside hydrolase N-terminal domain-containing protein [Gracilibacillus sp. YIM 98692]
MDKNKLLLKYPASWWGNIWREGLPSGNGEIGASVYGAVKNETILINHEALRHMGKKNQLPDVSYTLPEVRKMMEEEKYLDASWHLSNTLKEKGYDTRLASLLPLVDLKVSMPSMYGFKHYRRMLDMETGEVKVKWEDGHNRYERNLFVSRADNMIVYEILSNGENIDAEFELAFHESTQVSMKDRCSELKQSVKVKTEDNYIFYACKNDDHTDFGAVINVVPKYGKLTTEGNKLSCKNSKSVLVFVKVFVKSEYEKEWDKLRDELEGIDSDYHTLFHSHATLHGELFRSSSLELVDGNNNLRSNEELLLDAYDGEAPTSLVEKMWTYGRYLFISGTRNSGQPFGMYGLWGGEYDLMWCLNMANENIQMMYWHVNVGGLSKLSNNLIDYYHDMINDFRENAKKLYGCRGIYIPAGSSPGIGVPNQIVPVIMNWTGAAGWLAQHFYDYYLYTGDKKMLRDKILPFMREVVLFYEDFLVKGNDGFYTFFPSVSPENTPGNFMPKDGNPIAHPMPTTKDATMDFAIMKEVIRNLIEGSEEIELYSSEEIKKWSAMLTKIPSYRINKDGAIREWMDQKFDDRYNHRHLSHIYPIFPGREYTEENDSELFKAFEKAVKKRKLGAQTGWSLSHMSSIYARMNNGNKALECLNILSRSCLLNNFVTVHNDWRDMGLSMEIKTAPIQMDANMGWVNAVQEMLIFVSPTMIKLLPAIPDKWQKGRFNNFRFCTGRVSVSWDIENEKFDADIIAERDTAITLKLPNLFEHYQVYSQDGAKITPSSIGNEYYDVKLKANNRFSITSNKQIISSSQLEDKLDSRMERGGTTC